MSSPHNDICP
ncbi:uncharacterized protein FFC1_15906 [Fusarium fujikuroi]|nr:uncharacterized protein FFC1_15906 [Fusarium fujikuroi]